FLPERRCTLLFSATLPPAMRDLAKAILNNPERVDVGDATATPNLDEEIWPVARVQKTELLIRILEEKQITAALIFCRTRAGASDLAERLTKSNRPSEVLHADRSQAERREALAAFADGRSGILVATD